MGTIRSELLSDIQVDTPPLPAPLERIDLLVEHLAAQQEPGSRLKGNRGRLRARLGCLNDQAARWVVDQAVAKRYVEASRNQSDPNDVGLLLTAEGWQRFEVLQRSGAGSRHAFMAMRFGDAQLNRVFAAAMQPAVAQTGFELRTVAGKHQQAGSIDDRMRVEIRTSRFLVCDLTHGNRGAYWEAGFAEGLGRPVFYTCRRDVLQDKTHDDHPHFDTAHQLIIDWAEGETLAADMQRLKDAIRATLPDEAKMEDDERAAPAA
ncbi:MAG: hypothetical protein KIT17_03830 [Rubrivivax sp.]|nr:hypothetical protein [Rubrivivax sp.]